MTLQIVLEHTDISASSSHSNSVRFPDSLFLSLSIRPFVRRSRQIIQTTPNVRTELMSAFVD